MVRTPGAQTQNGQCPLNILYWSDGIHRYWEFSNSLPGNDQFCFQGTRRPGITVTGSVAVNRLQSNNRVHCQVT
jgi:hypothetical protein